MTLRLSCSHCGPFLAWIVLGTTGLHALLLPLQKFPGYFVVPIYGLCISLPTVVVVEEIYSNRY